MREVEEAFATLIASSLGMREIFSPQMLTQGFIFLFPVFLHSISSFSNRVKNPESPLSFSGSPDFMTSLSLMTPSKSPLLPPPCAAASRGEGGGGDNSARDLRPMRGRGAFVQLAFLFLKVFSRKIPVNSLLIHFHLRECMLAPLEGLYENTK